MKHLDHSMPALNATTHNPHSGHHNHPLPSPSHSDHSDHSDHQGHMMMMYFHSSSHSTLLFSFWQTNSILTMLMSCVAIIILGILYEGLKAMREKLLIKNGCCDSKLCGAPQVALVASSSFGEGGGGDQVSSNNHNSGSKDVPLVHKPSSKSLVHTMWTSSHVIQTLLHGVQILLSYSLMLIFMTYNVWPCVAVVIGAMLGYFLFSWRRNKCQGCVPASAFVIGDHCH